MRTNQDVKAIDLTELVSHTRRYTKASDSPKKIEEDIVSDIKTVLDTNIQALHHFLNQKHSDAHKKVIAELNQDLMKLQTTFSNTNTLKDKADLTYLIDKKFHGAWKKAYPAEQKLEQIKEVHHTTSSHIAALFTSERTSFKEMMQQYFLEDMPKLENVRNRVDAFLAERSPLSRG